MNTTSVKTLPLLLLSSLIFFTSSLAAECVDPDGDGYGLNGKRPCRTRINRKLPVSSSKSLSIVNRTVEMNGTSALITVRFNQAAKTQLRFGETPSVRRSGSYKFMFLRQFSQTINNLKPNTKYYYRIIASTRNHKQKLRSEIFEFTTSSSTTSTKPTLEPLNVIYAEAHQTQSTKTKVKFEFSKAMPAYIIYGLSEDDLRFIGTVEKNSLKFHDQALNGLEAGKEYFFRVISNEQASEIFSFSTPETTVIEDGDRKAQDWADLGYDLRFDHSVTEADYGRTGKDFLTDQSGWANGNPTHTNWIDESLVSFTSAPDGTPAMRATIGVGQQQALNWRGEQLGQNNTNKDAVFSIEIWIDNPGTLQSYIGAGHYWGSAPGVTHTGGGAVNFPDSWSIRAVHSLDGKVRGYVYPTRARSNTSYGDVIHGTQNLPVGRWVTLESEIISNDPGTANGVLRTLVDGKVSNETTNLFLRNANNVYPKGMGMLIRNNSRAKKTETVYIRNWRIYTKP